MKTSHVVVENNIRIESDESDECYVDSVEIENNTIVSRKFVKKKIAKLDSVTDFQSTSDDNDDIIDTIKTLTDSKTKRGDFKIASMGILLTYQKAKLNKIDLFNFVTDVVENKKRIIEEYIVVHEKAGRNVYHTHVYFKLNEAFRSSAYKVFDFTDVRPNMERVRHRTHSFLEKVCKYLLDKDTHPYTNLSSTKIQQIKGDKEIPVISSTKKDISTVSNNIIKIPNISLKPIHNLEDNIISPMQPWNFKSWQKFLLNVIENEVDESAFYWCWEPIGQMGKTKLAHYIETNYNNVLMIKDLSSYINMITTYINVIKKRMINIVILDVPRIISNDLLNPENNGIFKFIELLKDGYINTSDKRIKLTPCHVIVFSNSLTNVKLIRSDRWKIIKILEDGEACMGTVNVSYEDTYIQ